MFVRITYPMKKICVIFHVKIEIIAILKIYVFHPNDETHFDILIRLAC